MDQINEKMNFVISLQNQNDWQIVSSEEVATIVTEKKFLPGYSIACFRSSGFVNANSQHLCDYVLEFIFYRVQILKHIDPDISEFQIVDHLIKKPGFVAK